MRIFFVFLALTGFTLVSYGQTESDERAMLDIKNGLSVSKEPIFKLNLRFRVQNRLGLYTVSGNDLSINEIEARVRRLRLRFDGYVLSPKFAYYIQLSFSKADQDLEKGLIAQTVRDAIVYYHFNPNFYVGFGQSKLPGNRQRVTSSGNQQMPERSFVNAKLTLDRDFGLFAYWTIPAKTMVFRVKTAVSSGEGRNITSTDNGLAYTGKLEWLPFGAFDDNGDYSEGDQGISQKPRLSLTAGYSYNDEAVRSGGQLGSALYEARDIQTFIADFILKYKGWAVQAEYLKRETNGESPITYNEDGMKSFVYKGWGINGQASKMIGQKTELVARYAEVHPANEIAAFDPLRKTALLGINYYLNGHRIKAQFAAGYEWTEGMPPPTGPKDFWTGIFQVEFGI